MCNASPKGIQEISINESSCLASLQSDDTDVCREFCGNGEEEALTAGRERDQSSYVEERIFHLLLPALEETLFEASKWNALRVQKCRFSGLDYLAEILWNRNPRRSRVFSPPLNAVDIPLFRQWLRLRPPYPKSWLWSEDEAALHLQRFVRGWLVRKRTDVQEMRQFWKNIAGRNFLGKETDTIQQQGIRVSNGEYGTVDADSVRCRKYRWMLYTNKVNVARAKDTL